MGPERKKVLAKHVGGVALAAPAIVAIGSACPPLGALLAAIWIGKAAKDGVRAAIKDEMEEDVQESLRRSNLEEIDTWQRYRGTDRHFETTKEVTITRSHPIFPVTGSYTFRRTDRDGD